MSRAFLVAGLLLLTACPAPQAADAGIPESPWPALTEKADWQGLAPPPSCTVNSSPPVCGEPSYFNLSTCDTSSLTQLDSEGAWNNHVIFDAQKGQAFASVFFLKSDGGRDTLGGAPLNERSLGQSQFFLSATLQTRDGGTLRRSYSGCSATDPQTVTGCFVQCLNGVEMYTADFEAHRVVRRPSEVESHQLALVSETAYGGGEDGGPRLVPVDVYVTHHHAYVVALGGGMNVYDVSNPARPVLKKVIHDPHDNYWNGVWSKGDALYVASATSGVITFDISNPADPIILATLPSVPVNVHTVFVQDNVLLGISPEPNGEVLLFDVTDEQNPSLLTRFVADGNRPDLDNHPHDAFLFENRLYVNYWALGYVIADAQDLSAVQQLGNYRYPHSKSHASAVGRYGDRVISFEGGEDWGAHLRALDVTDPKHVRLIGEYRLRSSVSIHNMVLVGTKLYLSHYQDGVRVLDVSDPSQPTEIAYFNDWDDTRVGRGSSFYDGAIGIRVPGDGYLYVVDSIRGLLILREQ